MYLLYAQERRLTALDFGLFAACGAVGCTSTHFTVIPLDVVKTRLQTDPGRYDGLAEGVATIAREVKQDVGIHRARAWSGSGVFVFRAKLSFVVCAPSVHESSRWYHHFSALYFGDRNSACF